MYFIYFLRSINHPDKIYTGSTNCLEKRLEQHNNGESIHTNKFKPWEIETYVMADTRETAEEVERYFKSNAGHERIQRYIDKNPEYHTISTFFDDLKVGTKFAKSSFECYKTGFFRLCSNDEI